MKRRPHLLIVLDGFGYRSDHEYNAIFHGKPKHLISWMATYPHSLLHASGHFVGLLPNMIGNSEVGHLTLGSGRIVKQPILQLHEQIASGSFFKNNLLIERFNSIKKSGKRLHLMGLLSDGGVHSHIDHLLALIKMAHQQGIESVVVHCFLDGRDTPPQSAAHYLRILEDALADIPSGKIGTLHGRFYAMDRDNHWERTERSYKIITSPHKPQFSHWQEALTHSYNFAITDEFFVPVSLHEDAACTEGELLIFFNFRADRARQLTKALIEPLEVPFSTQGIAYSSMITCTSYSHDFKVAVLIHKAKVYDTFFDRLELSHKRIFTIAETEKYAHVTYFFNGGKELVRPNETRILIPSKRHFATYAQTPKMSAPEITDTVLHALKEDAHDFYLINYANADMVGHSGDFHATCEAVTCLDTQLDRIYQEVVELRNGTLYITADHGKAEDMWDFQANQPRTAHTTNKVPFIVIQKDIIDIPAILPTELATVAPYILNHLGLPIPAEMKHGALSYWKRPS